jgi:hypothetical protein
MRIEKNHVFDNKTNIFYRLKLIRHTLRKDTHMGKRLWIVLVLVAMACVSVGNKIDRKMISENIIIGKTTQRDVVGYLGYPKSLTPDGGRPMYILTQDELQKYLYRQTIRKYEDIPPGKYEAWSYWYLLGHSTGCGRRDSWITTIIIFDDKGIVYKKFFSDVSRQTFNPLHRDVPSADYEELK